MEHTLASLNLNAVLYAPLWLAVLAVAAALALLRYALEKTHQ